MKRGNREEDRYPITIFTGGKLKMYLRFVLRAGLVAYGAARVPGPGNQHKRSLQLSTGGISCPSRWVANGDKVLNVV